MFLCHWHAVLRCDTEQVGLVAVAVREGVHVGDDGYSSRLYEGEQQQRPVAPREVSRIAFGSCT